ncbi:hypothetical protein MMC07_007252 [Pseudocyphellaria aurata]|nr:hypothetical protein [Pseudocyphellaria aurata]
MSRERLLKKGVSDENGRLHYASSSDLIDDQSEDILIFMITGNPGLIKYYQPFLSTLHTLLSSSSTTPSARFSVCGHSLDGFEHSNGEKKGRPARLVKLKEEVDYMEEKLFEEVRSHQKAAAAKEKNLKVILMGHSVGAYILLELIQGHRSQVEDNHNPDFDLIGGILLFPTITHLAQSPQGMIYSRILQLPNFPHIAGAIVNFVLALVPAVILCRILQLVMRVPKHAAEASADLVKSPVGVRQALFLAKDEMETITDDKWTEKVWGAATAPGTDDRDTANSNLVFYWGENDKLVANQTRDDLIEAKGHLSSIENKTLPKDWKPSMFIDKDGIPHAFCLKHSETVAEKVKGWVDQIVEKHRIETPR